jgi:hypothetical protein
MSFEEQERALFDLLFDSELRDKFCENVDNALESYELTKEEQADFSTIRPDALLLDAKMRRNILLGHICRAFPVSFAIISSLNDGKSLLKKLVDIQIMRTPSLERATAFGSRLRDELTQTSFDSTNEQTLVVAIVEAELAMAWTAATLKREVLKSGHPPDSAAAVSTDCMSKPVKLATYVGAAILPLSYVELKRTFCKVADSELWNHLSQSPVTKSLRKSTFQKEDPRLLVMRARIEHMSLCEPTVDHQTVELSEGFAQLFQHVNGSISVEQILAHLQQAGASEQILKGVSAGFQQLFDTAMLETL